MKAAPVPPPRDSRDSGAQCETGALWREKHAGRDCASISLPGGRRGRCGMSSAATGCMGPESCTRLLFQNDQISRSAARESKLPNFPLHNPSHLTGSSTERFNNSSWYLGRCFSFSITSIVELISLLSITNAEGVHVCSRIENAIVGLQQVHATALSHISTTAQRRHRVGALYVTTTVMPEVILAKEQIQRFK